MLEIRPVLPGSRDRKRGQKQDNPQTLSGSSVFVFSVQHFLSLLRHGNDQAYGNSRTFFRSISLVQPFFRAESSMLFCMAWGNRATAAWADQDS